MKIDLNPEYTEFVRLYKEESDIYREVSQRLGTSDSTICILCDLCILGEGCSQRDICKNSYLSKQTVNSAIRKLESGGYIYLEKGRGRSTHIYLTDSGNTLINQKIMPIIQAETRAFSQLGEDGILLKKLMGTYLANLRREIAGIK